MNCPSCGHENIDGIDRCENCLAPFRQLDIPSIDAAESFAQSVMEDNLGRLEYEPPVCVSPDALASDVTKQMKDANTGCALVVDGGKLVGIFTEHDVLLRLTGADIGTADSGTAGVLPANEREARTSFAEGLPANQIPTSEIPLEELRADEMEFGETNAARTYSGFEVPIAELMSRNPETLHEKDSVAEALNRMSVGRYRHLPVRKSDGSYAVASIKSVLNYIAKEDW
ncbi:MAG TPA: CBS domain-containing protein [Pyrinomonadaceae bacterium]|nr:CBS domain-containing protein [Pyrinomonadaceae bacterium]